MSEGAQRRLAAIVAIVLPFTNMSGDGEQEYFSDGVTTELSRFNELFAVPGHRNKILSALRKVKPAE